MREQLSKALEKVRQSDSITVLLDESCDRAAEPGLMRGHHLCNHIGRPKSRDTE
jgi:hypothetical protein